MISSRGPNHILVLDRLSLPIRDIADAVITKTNFSDICKKYLITVDEIYACIETFTETHGPSENDFIEIQCERIDGDIQVETAGLSDWVFLTALTYGRSLSENEDVIRRMFAFGLEAIMVDCLTDIKLNSDGYKHSQIHSMVFESFEQAYGTVSIDEVDMLLGTLYNEHDNGETIH